MSTVTYKRLYEGTQLTERTNIQEQYSTFDLKEWLRLLYDFRKTSRVLDLGCGNGKELIYFSPFFKKGVGVDASESLIQKARETKRGLKIRNIEFINADCNTFCPQDDKFDVIYSNFAFYYFHKEKVTENIVKLLSGDGNIFIGGSPDENAPEITFLVSCVLEKKEIPQTYQIGFSDVCKYRRLFKKYFTSVQFYRFINVIHFPTAGHFMYYLMNTTLAQGLKPQRKESFLRESRKMLVKKKNFNLTKIVDVLRAAK